MSNTLRVLLRRVGGRTAMFKMTKRTKSVFRRLDRRIPRTIISVWTDYYMAHYPAGWLVRKRRIITALVITDKDIDKYPSKDRCCRTSQHCSQFRMGISPIWAIWSRVTLKFGCSKLSTTFQQSLSNVSMNQPRRLTLGNLSRSRASFHKVTWLSKMLCVSGISRCLTILYTPYFGHGIANVYVFYCMFFSIYRSHSAYRYIEPEWRKCIPSLACSSWAVSPKLGSLFAGTAITECRDSVAAFHLVTLMICGCGLMRI